MITMCKVNFAYILSTNYRKFNFPVNPHVCQIVSRSVCQNFLKDQEVFEFPCTYRSTCWDDVFLNNLHVIAIIIVRVRFSVPHNHRLDIFLIVGHNIKIGLLEQVRTSEHLHCGRIVCNHLIINLFAISILFAILKGPVHNKNENLYFLAPSQTQRMQPIILAWPWSPLDQCFFC